MKFVRSLIAVSAVAAASMLVACGDDGSSTSPSSSSDCSVTNGVVVVSPAAGEKFKIGDTVTVVYGSDIDAGGFRFQYRENEDDSGTDFFKTSQGPSGPKDAPDGKTCYEQKVVLSKEKVIPSKEAFIRVIPYNETSKGANSATFTVTE